MKGITRTSSSRAVRSEVTGAWYLLVSLVLKLLFDFQRLQFTKETF